MKLQGLLAALELPAEVSPSGGSNGFLSHRKCQSVDYCLRDGGYTEARFLTPAVVEVRPVSLLFLQLTMKRPLPMDSRPAPRCNDSGKPAPVGTLIGIVAFLVGASEARGNLPSLEKTWVFHQVAAGRVQEDRAVHRRQSELHRAQGASNMPQFFGQNSAFREVWAQ